MAFGDKFEQVVSCFTTSPRRRLDIQAQEIKEGEEACLTLFDPTLTWNYNSTTNKSKSTASPFFGKEQKGKVVAVVNKGQLHINEY